MLLLLLFAMLIGWCIGGPDRESRRVLATTTGMRNVIVVLYVARYCFTDTNVFMVPIVYLALMAPQTWSSTCILWGGRSCGLRKEMSGNSRLRRN
jgi:hypothetical protein